MIPAVETLHPLDNIYIARFFHYAYPACVTGIIAADLAEIVFGNIKALAAEPCLLLHRLYGLRDRQRFRIRHREDEKGQPLRGLSPYPGKPRKFVYQVIDNSVHITI